MKPAFLLFVLLISASVTHAQYDKNKLIGILTDGNSKAWSVKGVNIERPEKSFTFDKNMSVVVEKDYGKGVASQPQKWTITSADNIRWFINIGIEQYELIVSYAKNGSQYIKLTRQAGKDKISGYYEINLYPLK